MVTKNAIKAQAKALCAQAELDGRTLVYGHALDLVSRSYGWPDWNTGCAALKAGPPRKQLAAPAIQVEGKANGDTIAAVISPQNLPASWSGSLVSADCQSPINRITFERL